MKFFSHRTLSACRAGKFKFGFLLHWGPKFAIQPLLGIQWHVIPRWKGIATGIKMAPIFLPNHTLSGRRAQKCDFGRVIVGRFSSCFGDV